MEMQAEEERARQLSAAQQNAEAEDEASGVLARRSSATTPHGPAPAEDKPQRASANAPTAAPAPSEAATSTSTLATGADPRWSPSATPAQQARNIKNANKMKEKQRAIAKKANETKARGRQQVKDYLAEMSKQSTVTRTQPPAEARKAAWSQAAARQQTGIASSVGPNGKNDPADVAKLQDALVTQGAMDPKNATGYIGTPTTTAINTFQKNAGLKVDGVITPGGPTEAALTQDQKAANVGEQPLSAEKTTPRTFTQKQLDIAAQANATKALGRQKVNDYLDIMRDRKAAGQTLDASARKAAWDQVAERDKTGATADTTQQLEQIAKQALGNVWQGNVADMALTVDLKPYEVQIAGRLGEAALAAVIAERKFGTNNVFQGQIGGVIENLKNNGHAPLAGKLTGLRADIKFAPSWNPVSLTDEELKSEIESSRITATGLYAVSKIAPTPLGRIAFKEASKMFKRAAEKMKNELDRRK